MRSKLARYVEAVKSLECKTDATGERLGMNVQILSSFKVNDCRFRERLVSLE